MSEQLGPILVALAADLLTSGRFQGVDEWREECVVLVEGLCLWNE
jgi:hypothetical protein